MWSRRYPYHDFDLDELRDCLHMVGLETRRLSGAPERVFHQLLYHLRNGQAAAIGGDWWRPANEYWALAYGAGHDYLLIDDPTRVEPVMLGPVQFSAGYAGRALVVLDELSVTL